MGGVEGLLSLLAEAVTGLTRASPPGVCSRPCQLLPIAVPDDEAGVRLLEDQGGGKRRLDI
jgi:hypothetical protein